MGVIAEEITMTKSELSKEYIESYLEDICCEYGRPVKNICEIVINEMSDNAFFCPQVIIHRALRALDPNDDMIDGWNLDDNAYYNENEAEVV